MKKEPITKEQALEIFEAEHPEYTVMKIGDLLNVKLREASILKKQQRELLAQELIEQVNEGVTLRALALKYGMNYQTVWNIVNKYKYSKIQAKKSKKASQ